MNRHRLQRWLTVGAMLALPVLAQAQEATLSGTVTEVCVPRQVGSNRS